MVKENNLKHIYLYLTGNRNTPRPIKKEEDSLDDMFPNSEGDNDRWRFEENTTILPLLIY